MENHIRNHMRGQICSVSIVGSGPCTAGSASPGALHGGWRGGCVVRPVGARKRHAGQAAAAAAAWGSNPGDPSARRGGRAMLRRDEAGGWRFWAPTAGLRIPRPDLRSGGGPCHGARRRPSYAAARRGRRFLGSCGRSAHPTTGSGSPLRRASMGGGLQRRRAGSLLGWPGRRRRQRPAAVVPGDGRPRQPSDGLAWAAFINACEDDGGR
jgi:hypothetical protein